MEKKKKNEVVRSRRGDPGRGSEGMNRSGSGSGRGHWAEKGAHITGAQSRIKNRAKRVI